MDMKQGILNWIINQNKDYNYINKRFQDTVMNYFMEDYIAPLLMQDYNLQVYREIHVILKNKLKQDKDRVLPKYMGILNIYSNELKDKNRYNEYNRKLCSIIQEETTHTSSNYNSQMWKKLVAFLLLEHSVNNAIKNFNGMWQSAFPDCPLKKVKLPKCSKNNTSYYKKRMQILKQKELEFDFNLNDKNNQLILNMLISNASISTDSKSNSPLICEISNKPQYFNVQIQTKSVTAPLMQNSLSKITSSQAQFQNTHSSQSYSSTNCVNEKNIIISNVANQKVEIKQEDIQESLEQNKRRYSSNELGEDNEEEQDYDNYPSDNTSRLAKIEEGQYENEYEYVYQQQQLNQQYATSSQLTISNFEIQQKLPIQQQKIDLRQQQQNQIYYCVNNSTSNSSNYNNKNHQNLYNTLNNFNNNNINNNINYNYYSDKLHSALQYQDEANNNMLIQEPHVLINNDFNETIEQRQIEDPYYCGEDYSKQFQPISMLGFQSNNLNGNNFIYNNEYSDFQ